VIIAQLNHALDKNKELERQLQQSAAMIDALKRREPSAVCQEVRIRAICSFVAAVINRSRKDRAGWR
jgi:hypothetical protein